MNDCLNAEMRDSLPDLIHGNLDPTIARNALAKQLKNDGRALDARPTFVSLWIGNNDVLGAATSGRVIDDVRNVPQFAAHPATRARRRSGRWGGTSGCTATRTPGPTPADRAPLVRRHLS